MKVINTGLIWTTFLSLLFIVLSLSSCAQWKADYSLSFGRVYPTIDESFTYKSSFAVSTGGFNAESWRDSNQETQRMNEFVAQLSLGKAQSENWMVLLNGGASYKSRYSKYQFLMSRGKDVEYEVTQTSNFRMLHISVAAGLKYTKFNRLHIALTMGWAFGLHTDRSDSVVFNELAASTGFSLPEDEQKWGRNDSHYFDAVEEVLPMVQLQFQWLFLSNHIGQFKLLANLGWYARDIYANRNPNYMFMRQPSISVGFGLGYQPNFKKENKKTLQN